MTRLAPLPVARAADLRARLEGISRDLQEIRRQVSALEAATDHGALSGLADDDHTQYLRTDGGRACTGTQEFDAGLSIGRSSPIVFDLAGNDWSINVTSNELHLDRTDTTGTVVLGATDATKVALQVRGDLTVGNIAYGGGTLAGRGVFLVEANASGSAGTLGLGYTNSDAVSVGGALSAIGFYGNTRAAQTTGWAVSNKTTDKTLDCDGTLDQVADVLGTLIDTLKAMNLLGA